MTTLTRFSLAGATLILAVGLTAPATLAGETVVLDVNSFEDLPDANLLDGIADADLETKGPQVTLRAAIMHANGVVPDGPDGKVAPTPYRINLPAGVYKLKRKGAEEDSGDGDDEFEPVLRGEADPAWVVYLVAEK